jgi:hypothetical protein
MNTIEINFNAANETITQLRERLSNSLQFPFERIVISHEGTVLEDESDGLQNIQTVSVTFLGEHNNPLLLQDVLRTFGAALFSVGLTWTFLMSIGFTTTGIAAGSIAAQWMSSIALANGVGVVSGSLYAMLQSAMMGGFLLSPIGMGALFIGIVAGFFTIRR